MNEQETIPDIIAEMRGFKRYAASDSSDCRYVAYWLYQTFADRLDAALKHERGDAAKLREALKRIVAASIVAKNANAPEWILQRMADIFAMATTALAVPPRNCDVLKLEEGHPVDIADQVWRAYKHSHMGSYLYVCDLLRCIGWLLSPATEKGGGAK